MSRLIYWRVGKDTGVFHDLKTLEGAIRRLRARIPDRPEYEVQFDAPIGSVWQAEAMVGRRSPGGTDYVTTPEA